MRNKYNAVKTEIDGWRFDSELESEVYLELKRLHDIGAIKGIRMQHPYQLL
jgi:ribosomal protein S13